MDVEKLIKENATLKRRVTELEAACKDASALLLEMENSPGGARFRDPTYLGLGADGTALFEYVGRKLRRAVKRWDR